MDFASYRKAGLLAVAKAGGLTLPEKAQIEIYNTAYSAEARKHKHNSGGSRLHKKKQVKTRKNKRKCKH